MNLVDRLKNATGLAAMLKSLGVESGDVTAAVEVLKDLEITKGSEGMVSQSLAADQIVEDRWHETQMHKHPTAEQIKVGPTQGASGGNAERMVHHYSRPAPQDNLTVTAEALQAELGSMRAYGKAQDERMGKLAKGYEALTTVLTALLTEKAEGESEIVPGESASFAKWQAGKAQGFWRSAKSFLNQAVTLRDRLDDLEGDVRKSAKAQIKVMRQRAAKAALKALVAAYAAKSGDSDPAEDIRKSIVAAVETDPVLKADIAAFHDKDKEKDEEKRARKSIKRLAKRAAKKAAAKAAAKAARKVATAAGGGEGQQQPASTETSKTKVQADKQDGETKNQDDSSKEAPKSVTLDADTLKKALEGSGVLTASVQQIMETIMNRPLSSDSTQPLTLAKSGGDGDPMLAIDSRIDQMVNEGTLDQVCEMRARDLLQKLTLVKAGQMTQDMWNALKATSPLVVQEIYKQAA